MVDGQCFICNVRDDAKPLHNVMTFRTDRRVRKCALQLNNTMLLAKLENGDLIAQEALYHGTCLCDLYRKATNLTEEEGGLRLEKQLHGVALAELICDIEEESELHVFKLADLVRMYENRLSAGFSSE